MDMVGQLIPNRCRESREAYVPCQDYRTIFRCDRRRNASNPTWKFYTPIEDLIWSAPIGVSHLFNTVLGTKIIVDRNEATDLYDDINDLNGHTLANLTYVVPCPSWSDHPAVTNEGHPNGNGPTWVGFIASEVGKSHHWTDGDTAIIVVWDDWGGC